MIINIEINDRQYSDIEQYCKVNGLNVEEYIVGIINEKHAINKFGDLNDILPKTIEESTIEVKKRGRPKKTKVDEKLQVNDNTKIVEDRKNEVIETKPIVEETKKNKEEVTVVKPTVKRKRTLKTL